MTTISLSPASALGTARQALQRHPEAWVLLISACAWAAMSPHLVAGRACHQVSFWGDWRAWLSMVLAMMLPLQLPALRHTAVHSLRSREQRAILVQLVAWLSPWAVAGLAVAWLQGRPQSHEVWLAPVVFALAALWAAGPLYARWMRASHRLLPVRPRGWRADLDCARLGVLQGLPCLGTCALLMVGCALTGHGAVAMVGGALLARAERNSFRPRPWLVPAGAAGLAVWYGAVALLGAQA